MAKDSLSALIHEKNQKARSLSEDWKKKCEEWIRAVHSLYDTIEKEYLKNAINDVKIERSEKVVTEKFIGEYRIPELKLLVGDEQIVFSPKGAMIFGARGRIDILGDRADATIVWNGGNHWDIVVSRTPIRKLELLTADSLADVFREIMRP